ncbi:magnesium ion transmembrane transporter [Musa troglodytarum]|uniref:Magnesium ion transmembrane transporter n=1 Tax=Musa troglodytarum TaxID=320322 RepID=A0A9E7GVI5_9LILI|nr:magnesium ion transmembrane transporter [Musa troglodytarum]
MDQRELFHNISSISKDNKSMAKDSFAFLTRYLATFSGVDEDADTMNEAKEEAVRAVTDFCDLLDMPAVAQLEKDGKYAVVYQFLKIFVTQRLDAYLDFHSANSTILHNKNEITDDEVEYWVVIAITSKLLDCKMDQINQVVIHNVANGISTTQTNNPPKGLQGMQGFSVNSGTLVPLKNKSRRLDHNKEIRWSGKPTDLEIGQSGGRRRRGRGGGRWRMGQDLDDVDVPKDPVLGGGAVGDVVGDGVAPGGEAAVAAEVVAVAGLELDLDALAEGLPLEGRVEAGRQGQADLLAGDAEEEGFVGGGKVAAVAAAETERVGGAVHALHRPPSAARAAVAVLADVFPLLLRHQELVVVAPQPHHLRPGEQLHQQSKSYPTLQDQPNDAASTAIQLEY